MNEEQIIRVLWKYSSATLTDREQARDTGTDPFSDDGSWFQNSNRGRLTFFKSDMLVSSTDAPPTMSLRQIAMKAITGCVSDFAAKGVPPAYGLLSLAIPERFATLGQISEIGRGFRDSANRYGLKLIGGDTNEAKDGGLIIAVSICGFADSIVRRSGARPGHLIGVSGDFGLQSIGLYLLLKKSKCKDSRIRENAIDLMLNPRARLSIGISISKYISSSIDSSDGLALSLYYLAEASGVDLVLNKLPSAKGVVEFAKENSLSAEDLIIFGGEEFEIVCTFEKRHAKILTELGLKIIGEVHPMRIGKRPSVYFGKRKILRRGWLHFQR